MGPWLCSHGNRHRPACHRPTRQLQWGRGCVATEMGYRLVGYHASTAASMGPWLCSHGNTLENLARSRTPDSFNGAVAV